MNGIEAMADVHDRPRELAIRSQASGDGAMQVSVSDRGVGISEQAIDRLFTPFFTTKCSGMGMGLSICRSIIEAHGGRLSAIPNQERGATFQITLPLHREEAS
jgi:signal transduction histidine kinase